MQESEKDLPLNDIERQQVNVALEAILATEKFDAAPQMSAFLRYVVEQATDGQQSRIKAFTVAVDALGKPDTFDPQNDPVVRVLAGRLRAALTAYHTDNPNVPVRIKMAPGSYVPMFEPKDNLAERSTSNADEVRISPATKRQPCATNELSSQHPSENTQADSQAALENANNNDTLENAHGLKSNAYSTEHSGIFARLAAAVSATPTIALTGGLAAAVMLAVIMKNGAHNDDEPNVGAAMPDNSASSLLSNRSKPDQQSIFISAIDEGNKLENNLNALVSGVISENKEFGVYRILNRQSEIRFWPEEYILTISALELPSEIRVNLQMIEAITGQIVHSQAITLNENANNQLTHDEMAELTDAARLIVAENGPLGD